MLSNIRLKTLALALAVSGSAQAQSLEEAVLVIYDPLTASQWEKDGRAFVADDHVLSGRKTNEKISLNLSVRDCILTLTSLTTKPDNPSNNSGYKVTFDLNKVIDLVGVEVRNYGTFSSLTPKWQIGKGAYCIGYSREGAASRVPDKADTCTAPDVINFGQEGQVRQITEVKAAEDRLRKAYTFIREKYCKGRAF